MIRPLRTLAAVATVALSLAAFTAGDVALGRIAPAGAQTSPGQAGPQGGGAKGRQRFAEMLMSLNLSDDQKSRIKGIMADARAKMKTLTDPEAKRDTMRGAFKDIEAVLTPAQKTKMDAERAAYKAQHNSGGGDSSHS